jgi:hypothetical protein
VTEQIPQELALKLQFTAIAGGEPSSSYFWLLTKPTKYSPLQAKYSPLQEFIAVRELERAAATAIDRSRLGHVYVGCAPRTSRSGGLDAVERVWTLWADCDSDGAVERLRAFRPLPSIVNRSGSTLPSGRHKLHANWPLCRPLTPAAAKMANERLARALDADSGTNAARMLRPVGSLNHKHQPPTRVECVRLEPDVFTAAQIVGELDDVEIERPAAKTGTSNRPLVVGDVDLRSIPSAEFVPLLTGRAVTPDGYVQCPFHKNGQERTPSLHVSAIGGQWYCLGDCQQGGGLIEFYALLHGRSIPDRHDRHAFVRFAYEIKGAVSSMRGTGSRLTQKGRRA